ncbi:MAG: BtpA/SgcQ family protein [Oscillospiraceae bacterium]|nr:BtpA/SgcQ family protein [Oscillospiraceae bacterium]
MKTDFLKSGKCIIGMVHLKALPTAPLYRAPYEDIFTRAKEDLEALQEGGAHAAIIENFYDMPYWTECGTETLVAMANLVTRLKEIAKIPLGVNIQFGCAKEEVAVAAICGAAFIRCENFAESRGGSFGMAPASAGIVMRAKKQLDSECLVFADVNVKHSVPAYPGQTIDESIQESMDSGADAVIVTGLVTGKSPELSDIIALREKFPHVPLIIGSGVKKENIKDFLRCAEGVIVGTSLKSQKDGETYIDIAKVKELVAAV